MSPSEDAGLCVDDGEDRGVCVAALDEAVRRHPHHLHLLARGSIPWLVVDREFCDSVGAEYRRILLKEHR